MLTRLGAWCGVLAGLAIAVPGAIEAFAGESAPTSIVLGLSPAFAVPLLTALHLRQATAAGPFGAVAYTVNAVGLGLFGGAAFTLNLTLFFLGEQPLHGPTMVALLGSALVFATGTVLFGVAMLRAGIHPRVPAVGYVVALPVLAIAARLPDTPLTSVVHVLAGGSLLWLSVSCLESLREPGVPTAVVRER
ncbi:MULTISPECIES: hypothetical protein [unclassified Amycolatopsis]|uniref:hypothetical protein n=1 Tax=unclassified Amycolatopsis TaxID=2618356 RepID=UPI002874362A|nr:MULTISPECIES: hypothetical protein [unclassified Amycolatopsis]MDS0136681.1 hypothetical protein [Amycolatopsis sp. 505]MDS0143345.1 hypothetical protein [Amycolatopsis sp. CM201R]